MLNTIQTLQNLSIQATIDSTWYEGVAEGLKIAADVVKQQSSEQQFQTSPEPQPELIALPPVPRKSGPAVHAPKKARSAEIMAPTFDLLRQRGTWVTESEVVDALQKIGVEASSHVVRRVLNAGVRAGHLERRGDAFRAGALKQ